MFEPIAITGRACLLPGANSAADLWKAVVERCDLTSATPPGLWGAPFVRVASGRGAAEADVAACGRGGYVQGFDNIFDPTGFGLEPDRLAGFDAAFRWLLHCGREALADGRVGTAVRPRAGMIVGNLSYPSRGLSEFANATWLSPDGRPRQGANALAATPENRFMSGLPVMLAARALGLGGAAFALDAACASSLYAVKLACDRLHDRSCDVVVAGGINRADDLFLHVGFTTLGALSASGRSRPLTTKADGLLPAEGAALLTLKRLDDAVAAGDRVLAVIRGVGLSNDGSERGLLAPDGKGQIRAIRKAYEAAGIEPASIGFVECHATGTTTGDGEEIRSMAQVFAGMEDLPIGALKANLGHMITASGAASILKVIGAFETETLPPTIGAENPLEALGDTPMRLLAAPERWVGEGPRRAAVSAFGFGGNNAHLILEEPPRPARRAVPVALPTALEPEIAVCGIGIRLGEVSGIEAFVTRLNSPAELAGDRKIAEAKLPGRGLRFPPKDLRRSLGQQTLALEVAFDAMAGVQPFDHMECGVFFGMGCDPESARWGLRWRLAELLAERGASADPSALATARDAAAPALDSTAVVGTMPNVPANRLSTQFDLRGPAFTVSAEELSGIEALRLACRALAHGEIATALVGAVDLSCEPVHERAAAALLPSDRQVSADGAVALVLKRRADAEAAGDRIFALLPAGGVGFHDDAAPAADAVRRRFGHVHAASGLLEAVAGMVEAATRTIVAPDGLRPAIDASRAHRRSMSADSFAGQRTSLLLHGPDTPALRLRSGGAGPRLRLYGAADGAGLAAALDGAGDAPPADTALRLAIVARSTEELEQRKQTCRAALAAGGEPAGRGIFFGKGPAPGEAALVFAGANAYPDMGRGLFLAFPEIGDALCDRFPVAAEVAAELYGASGVAFAADPFGALKSASLICQAHAVVADRILGLKPPAVLGLSSGETNALFAFGIWRDMSDMFRELGDSGLYSEHLAGRLQAARRTWGLGDAAPLEWKSWLVSAPLAEVQSALGSDRRAEIGIILSPRLCFISGTREGCEAVIDRIGRHRVIEHAPALICHSAVLEPFAATWGRLHDRETHPFTGARFYSQAHNASYAMDHDSVREALLGQARRPIDFAATVERSWQDGVRVFVEAGPRNILSRAIAEVLGDRPHLALALDDGGRDPVEHLARVTAQLFAAGVPLDLASALRHLGGKPDAPGRPASNLVLSMPARMPAFDAGALGIAQGALAEAGALRAVPSDARPVAPAIAPARSDITPFPPAPPDLHVFARPRPTQEATVRPMIADETREAAAASPEPEILLPPYDRAQLERLAGGRISEVFGPRFREQDGYLRQVRMPMPPLLLADRVVTIEGEPGTLGTGRIVTETDITADAWYLDDGRMPVGLLIESGQADLLLISWMGIDFHNRGDRVYRLLGCEITFHDGGMPKVGDTLRFDIRINSHAQLGDVRMFFFSYDCYVGDRLLTSVRNGQAGFFSDAELAAAKGVNWTAPATLSEGRLERPVSLRPSAKRAFSADDLGAFLAGDAFTCFGPGFEQAAAHQRTPKPPGGRMRMIDEVAIFDPDGGPKGLGYLEAIADVPVDAWFYGGHFLNDPCMPGTLMADAAVQSLAFTMAAMGMTARRDGWRFEPVTSEPFKFVCRGQVIPDRPHKLRYEVFVTEIVDGPEPAIFATLLCTCDGLKVFHCPRFGLKLVRDWPLSTRPQWLDGAEPARMVRQDGDVRGDYTAMVACAWDRPSIPFGSGYARFDGAGNVPRLPGPPYLFISRVLDASERAWQAQAGVAVTTEYDVPPDAWYFIENDRPAMPYCVLAEVMLQPCGWLASYAGFALPGNVCYRNLDGSDAIQHAEITPDIGTLTVRATLTRVVRLGVLALVFFKTECHAGERLICSLETSFGLFTEADLAKQAGLTVTPEVRARVNEPSDVRIDLRSEAGAFFDGPVRLPRGKLRMIDEVTGYWPAGDGRPGRIRCRQTINPHAWYFKAHFYEDPVQPGSLGLDALLQALRSYLILSGAGQKLTAPRVEPIALGEPLVWKYRGQVVPRNKEVVTCLSVTVTEKADEVIAVAEGTLWADGLPIYEVKNMAIRIAGTPAALAHRVCRLTATQPRWVADHCPTYARPALPMMAFAAEAMAAARGASGAAVVAIEALRAKRWVAVPDDGVRLLTEVRASPGGYEVRIEACTGSEDRPLRARRFEAASGRVLTGAAYPPAPSPWPVLDDLTPVADPYDSGSLFHGPAFRLQTSLRRGAGGSSAILDLSRLAALGPDDGIVVLLDAFLHGVPHDQPETWLGDSARGFVAYPEEITAIRLYRDLPRSGQLRVEARPVAGGDGALRVRTQVTGDDGVIAEMEHVERLLPKGPLGNHPAPERRRFLGEGRFVPGMALSERSGDETRLSLAAVQRSNWLPGTLEAVYRAEGSLPELTAAIAVKEHFAARHGIHPSRFTVVDGTATSPLVPFRRLPFTLRHEPGGVRVASGEAGLMQPAAVGAKLAERLGIRQSIATAFLAAHACGRLAAVYLDEPALDRLDSGKGAIVVAAVPDGSTALGLSVLLAALGGRRTEIAEPTAPVAAAIQVAAALADYPAGRYVPLLAAAGADLRRADTDAFLLVPDRIPGDVLRRLAEETGRPFLLVKFSGDPERPVASIHGAVDRPVGPYAAGVAPAAVDLWPRTVSAVADSTGFSLASRAGHDTREAAWKARLSAAGAALAATPAG